MKNNQHRNTQIAAVFFHGGMTFALCGLSYWLITTYWREFSLFLATTIYLAACGQW